MEKTIVKFMLFSVFLLISADLRAETVGSDCYYKGRYLSGRVKVVDSFPDFEVKRVESFPDIRIKQTNLPSNCGEWEMVENFPDFTVKFVENFPDFTIQFVENFPGL